MSSFFVIIKCNLNLAIPLKDICLMTCSLRLSPLCSPSWWSCGAHRDLLLQGRPGGLGFKRQLLKGIGVNVHHSSPLKCATTFFPPFHVMREKRCATNVQVNNTSHKIQSHTCTNERLCTFDRAQFSAQFQVVRSGRTKIEKGVKCFDNSTQQRLAVSLA